MASGRYLKHQIALLANARRLIRQLLAKLTVQMTIESDQNANSRVTKVTKYLEMKSEFVKIRICGLDSRKR